MTFVMQMKIMVHHVYQQEIKRNRIGLKHI